MRPTRRRSIVAAAALYPFLVPARAAPPKVIGLLSYSGPAEQRPRIQAFHEAMGALGYVPGRDYVFEARFAEGDETRLPDLAAELLRLKPDVVLALASAAIRALRPQTSPVPVVSLGTGDPVGAGFAASLARPGGNFTGVSNMTVDTTPKLLEYLQKFVGARARLALLYDLGSSSAAGHRASARQAAQRIAADLVEVAAAKPAELDGAFSELRRQNVRGLIVAATGFTVANAKAIAAAALAHKIAAASQNELMAEAGLLLSYSYDRMQNFRLGARYVDKIFRGARAGELPIEQPTEISLTLNKRTASLLGLAIPKDLLLSANRVLE